jgi:hypothetical protein
MERPLILGALSIFLQAWLEIELEKLQESFKMRDITLSMLYAMMLLGSQLMSTTPLMFNQALWHVYIF